MPWPPWVARQFEKVPVNPSENDLLRPYVKLLYTLFPWDSEYAVVPQPMIESEDYSEFAIMFEILLDDKPVFLLQINPPEDLCYSTSRRAVDLNIRTHMENIRPNDKCPLPTLYAISAIGTKLRFYKKFRNDPIQPPLIDAGSESDTTPMEHCDCDVRREEGIQRFQAVIEEIKQSCGVF